MNLALALVVIAMFAWIGGAVVDDSLWTIRIPPRRVDR
jgi:hypothetical protein